MSLPGNIRDRDHGAYTLCNGEVARRVCVANGKENPVPVEIVQSGELIILNDSVSGVAVNETIEVFSYEVPIGKFITNVRIKLSGNNVSKFEIFINSALVDISRLTWTSFKECVYFNNLIIAENLKIIVNVTNESKSHLGDFECIFEASLRDI